MVSLLIVIIGSGALVFSVFAVKDLKNSKCALKEEQGKMWKYCLTSVLSMFFGTFGISDTAISVFMFRVTKTVEDRLLPGTIITSAILPLSMMSISFLSSIETDPVTLIICTVSESAGAVIGVHYIVKMDSERLKRIMAFALLCTAILIVVKIFMIGLAGGNGYELRSWRLFLAALFFFFFGAGNMVGIGATVPAMATLLLLGMSMKAVYPVIMTGNTISCFFGACRFLKAGAYNHKSLISSVSGMLAVIVAVRLVKEMDVSFLQYLMVGLLVYCSVSMLGEVKNKKRGLT